MKKLSYLLAALLPAAASAEVVDFESFAPNDTVSTISTSLGNIGVYGTDPRVPLQNWARIFDSSNPTCNDPDLGTPNWVFGGPGLPGNAATGNDTPLGNILIIQDAASPCSPDDFDLPALNGVNIEFDFSDTGPLTIDSVSVIDIDGNGPDPRIELFDAGNMLIGTFPIPQTLNNGVATIDVSTGGVSLMVVHLQGSGGLTGFEFDSPPQLARLGDRVWEDENANGIQDCDDTNMNGKVGDLGDLGPECGNGIPNLPVEAYDPGGDGVCDTGDDVPLGMMTMTNGEGFYWFENLIPGTYCVQFTLPSDDFCVVDDVNLGLPQFTMPNIGNDKFDSDANPMTGRTGNIPLMSGDNDLTNDAGVICPAKLGDRIWEDDGDGIQNCQDTNGNGIVGDAGDMGPECSSGIEKVKVELFACGADGIAGTMDDIMTGEIRETDSDGFYMFGGEPGVFDLPPGAYYTKVTKPDGTMFTVPNAGPDAFDSDCGPDGMTMCVALGSGDIDRTTDCGIVPPPPPQCNLFLDKTCAVNEPPPSDYECTKPIDELSMVWNGPEENISIIAYKGDTGEPVLANIGGIMTGDTVTVSGYAGSPNDVFWEVFDSGMNKIGESVFHLSCSDDDMNGPEDCGKLQGDGKQKKKKKSKKKSKDSGDSTTDFVNQWLFEGLVDAGGTLSCSAPPAGGPGVPFPTADSCSFTSASADVTYGYTVTNNGDPMTGVVVTDDLLGVVGGPIDLANGESAQFLAGATLFESTTNIATATGTLADGSACPAPADTVTVEKMVPPGSCDDGKATELVFSYTGDACSATTNYQLDKNGDPKFTCAPDPGVVLAGLAGLTIDKDAGEVSYQIIGNTVRVFRSDTIGEKLNSETQYTLTDTNGDTQSHILHTSCSKPLAVGDQFGALLLIQIVNEF